LKLNIPNKYINNPVLQVEKYLGQSATSSKFGNARICHGGIEVAQNVYLSDVL